MAPTRYADLPLTQALEHHAVEAVSPLAFHSACARYRFAAGFLPADGSVLDIGCGPGFGCRILAEAGARSVVGVDEQAEMIAHARREVALPAVSFVSGDALTLSFDRPFDLVTAFEVIEHVKEADRFLARCLDCVAPGGTLVLSTPNKLVHQIMGIRWPFHEREFGYSELVALLDGVVGRERFAIYGQNPFVLDQFRRREGRFASSDSWSRAAVRAVVPRRVLTWTRRYVPRRPRPAPIDDPVVVASCRIERTQLDVCETFLVVVPPR